MKLRALTFATMLIAGLCVSAADAGQIYSLTYSDVAAGSSVDLTTAGTLDWAKWGNGETTGMTTYTTPEKVGGSIINPASRLLARSLRANRWCSCLSAR